jgi:glycine dehydrogenase
VSTTFQSRHIGPREADVDVMLRAVDASSLDALTSSILPADIRRRTPVSLPEAESEAQYLARLRTIAARNRLWRSYVGLGYYGTHTPAVILRNVLENPGWYTPYTPYQAEIAQGRLESLLNFQTMVAELTGMEVANASLLDEATAAGEAVALILRVQRRAGPATVIVSDRVFPQVREVLASRMRLLGVTVVTGDVETMALPEGVAAVYVQSPDERGAIVNLKPIAERVHAAGALLAVGTDLLACALMAPPGEQGADVVVGNAQRFGVPLGYGGPHAAFFATREQYVRQAPGRIIGVSVDSHGRRAYRMALQTREQHIRREKATSNICTAQALLANIAAFYGVYHGPAGLRAIAARVHDQAVRLATASRAAGWALATDTFFDTIRVEARPDVIDRLRQSAERREINFRYPEPGVVQVALDETVEARDLADIAAVFGEASGRPVTIAADDGRPARRSRRPCGARRRS